MIDFAKSAQPIPRNAHTAGFAIFDFKTAEGVLESDVGAEVIMYVRDLLEQSETVTELAEVVSRVEQHVEEKDSGVGHRGKQRMREAAQAYLAKVCEVMGIDNPAPER